MKDYILVTGAAGFIGFNLCKYLLKEGINIVGFDNFNSYYDPLLKRKRIDVLIKLASQSKGIFNIVEADLKNLDEIQKLFEDYNISKVYNLAAQAGVRYSIKNPHAYIDANIVGFCNLLEACRKYEVQNLIYASSSSVYGGNTNTPFSEDQSVNHPVSLYAATKKSNELMAHTYSHLYNLPATGLRFFTVYGPWGRPDMALFLFTKAILENKPIKIFNNGEMIRDFTYIDDIVECLYKLLSHPATPDINFRKEKPNPSSSWAPHRIFNIGNSKPIQLMEYVNALEEELGIEAIKEFHPMQLGDVKITSSDNSALEDWIGFRPNTPVRDGVKEFVKWYKNFYKL